MTLVATANSTATGFFGTFSPADWTLFITQLAQVVVFFLILLIGEGLLLRSFLRPHFKIQRELQSYPISVRVGNISEWYPNGGTRIRSRWQGNESDAEVFEVRVWCLSVVNRRYWKFSADVRGCSANLFLDYVGEEIPLSWELPRIEPDEIRVPKQLTFSIREGSGSLRENLAQGLGVSYATASDRRQGTNSTNEGVVGLPKTPMPSGQRKELLLLVTHREATYANIIVPFSERYQWGKGCLTLNAMPLRLDIGKEYTLRVRFDGENYSEGTGRTLKLRLNSWDDLQLV